jgi:hypothetical protein
MNLGLPELILIFFILVPFVFSLAMFIDVMRKPNITTVSKVIWGLVITFTLPVGGIVYLFVRSSWYDKPKLVN